MEITDVRIKLSNREGDRLKAYCSIIFDGEFVVRDVRVVEGTNGLFVAMPSRKPTLPCPQCGYRNPVSSKFCNHCGAGMIAQEPAPDSETRIRGHRDIAHPITPSCREMLQKRVIEAYQAEHDKAEDQYVGSDAVDTPETDTVKLEEEPAEYDALIAGLGGQSRNSPPKRTASVSSSAADQVPSGDTSRSSPGGGRRQPRDGGREGPPKPRRQADDRKAPSPLPEAPVMAEELRPSSTESVTAEPDEAKPQPRARTEPQLPDTEEFGAFLETSEGPSTDQAPPQDPDRLPASDEPDQDDTGFGAGII